MRNMKITLLTLLGAVLLLQGCGMMGTRGYSPPYGESSATYTGGVLQATYPNTVFRTSDAVRDALRDFNMTVTESQRDTTGGRITASTREGTQVVVTMRAQKPDITTTGIKVGEYGNEELSRSISRRVEAQLQK